VSFNYKAVVEAGIYVGGDPLEVPETATTVRLMVIESSCSFEF
jgi:hypothetical protein